MKGKPRTRPHLIQVGGRMLAPVVYEQDDGDISAGYLTILPPKIAKRKHRAGTVGYIDAEGWARIKSNPTGHDIDPAYQ